MRGAFVRSRRWLTLLVVIGTAMMSITSCESRQGNDPDIKVQRWARPDPSERQLLLSVRQQNLTGVPILTSVTLSRARGHEIFIIDTLNPGDKKPVSRGVPLPHGFRPIDASVFGVNADQRLYALGYGQHKKPLLTMTRLSSPVSWSQVHLDSIAGRNLLVSLIEVSPSDEGSQLMIGLGRLGSTEGTVVTCQIRGSSCQPLSVARKAEGPEVGIYAPEGQHYPALLSLSTRSLMLGLPGKARLTGIPIPSFNGEHQDGVVVQHLLGGDSVSLGGDQMLVALRALGTDGIPYVLLGELQLSATPTFHVLVAEPRSRSNAPTRLWLGARLSVTGSTRYVVPLLLELEQQTGTLRGRSLLPGLTMSTEGWTLPKGSFLHFGTEIAWATSNFCTADDLKTVDMRTVSVIAGCIDGGIAVSRPERVQQVLNDTEALDEWTALSERTSHPAPEFGISLGGHGLVLANQDSDALVFKAGRDEAERRRAAYMTPNGTNVEVASDGDTIQLKAPTWPTARTVIATNSSTDTHLADQSWIAEFPDTIGASHGWIAKLETSESQSLVTDLTIPESLEALCANGSNAVLLSHDADRLDVTRLSQTSSGLSQATSSFSGKELAAGIQDCAVDTAGEVMIIDHTFAMWRLLPEQHTLEHLGQLSLHPVCTTIASPHYLGHDDQLFVVRDDACTKRGRLITIERVTPEGIVRQKQNITTAGWGSQIQLAWGRCAVAVVTPTTATRTDVNVKGCQ